MIEMLRNCRAYVGTDTGPTHLAGLMDVPMVLFGNFGFMWAAQAASSAPQVEVEEGWTHPEEVVDALMKFLGKTDAINPIVTDHMRTDVGFTHVFFVNMDRRPDRLAWIDHHLFSSGIAADRFPAVEVKEEEKGSFEFAGQRGCLLSHRGIVELAKSRGYESVLIFEDDAKIRDVPYFRRCAQRIISELMSHLWDLFYFQHVGDAPVAKMRWIQKTRGSWLTHAYAVHSRFYDRYLELADPEGGRPIDEVLYHSGARVYSTKDELVWQRDQRDTDINVKVESTASMP
jgi:hypothetical protein